MTRIRPRIIGRSRRITALALGTFLVSTTLFAGVAAASSDYRGFASGSSAFSASEPISRVHLIDGKATVADSRTFKVDVDTTQNLRDRQSVHITWSGAHPTGGVVFNVNSAHAADQEYPVVILQCRGVDSTTVPAAQRLSPQTCFTQNPSTRYQGPFRGAFPAYRVDRFASAADREKTVGAPTTIPSACINGSGAQRWVPFAAADGTKYYGGYNGCAGLAPEQSILGSDLSPSNETYGTTDASGDGQARFLVQDAQDNASLGCSSTVKCSLVIVPIEGISCDATAASLPPADQPAASDVSSIQKACTQTGFYRPGQPNGSQTAADPNSEVTVNGQLWWSASNWRNRITVPLSFAVTAASCQLFGGAKPSNIYGSEYLLQATQQWAPTFCSDKSLFPLQHTQTSEVEAKNLLATGVSGGKYVGVKAAFQAAPPEPKFVNPIVQAPTALSGFAIGYVMDGVKGAPYTKLKLDARLLAKLLSMSYPVLPAIRDDWANNSKYTKYKAASGNPLDMSVDPEFLALNPDMSLPSINQLEASAAVAVMSSDSDVMTALTSYINEDPEARAFLDGQADPWGMVVNPNYKGISLPVQSWPLLDTYQETLNNNCLSDAPQPYLPLVAGQVSDPAQITFNLQLGISSAQTNCVVTGETDSAGNRRLTGYGAQQPGIRFLLGLVSLADAERYGIQTAALETQRDADAPDKFTDVTGRYFVTPTADSLRAAAHMMQPDDSLGTWPVPYHRLRTEVAGRDAYPGTLLLSTDVPTAGLELGDAIRYSKFLTYVAGPGQVPGETNGDLADGYLPITSANGLGLMHDYTVAAAAAVRQQRAFVPKPSAPIIQAMPSSAAGSPHPSSTSGSSTSTRTTGATTPTSGPSNGAPVGLPNSGDTAGGDAPVATAGAGGATSAASTSPGTSAASSPAPASSSGSPQLVPTALTQQTAPGWTAHLLAVLGVVALVSGAVAAWTSGIGRRA